MHHSAKYVVDLIKLAEEHESLIQQLYETFAQSIPEQAEFWLGIASEEAHHVQIMKSLQTFAEQNFLRMQPDSKLEQEAIRKTIAHLQLYLEEVKKSGISPKRAAIIAKDLEEGTLEKHFDNAFEVDHEEARALLDKFKQDTEGHNCAMDALLVRKDEYTLLLDNKYISPIQLELARTLAHKENIQLEDILIHRFNVPRKALLDSLEAYFRLKPVDFPPDIQLPSEVTDLIQDAYEHLKARLYLPVNKSGNTLTIALGNPRDLSLRDELQCKFQGMELHYCLALPEELLDATDHLFTKHLHLPQESLGAVLKELKAGEGSQGNIDAEEEKELSEEDSAIVRLVNLMVDEAYTNNASDIHVEPGVDADVIIRYRVDGTLRKAMECPKHYARAILSRIKIMAGLDIAEHRKPQSGKIRFKRWGHLNIELRVETYPTAGNREDAVLRILAAGKPTPIESLSFRPQALATIKTIIDAPYGLFLCVGPTGSGKTTTLHSLLGYLNNDQVKIVTAEDPIEITQPGLRQLQVNRKADLTFANALRSFLRADPDIIMIGEMRDTETAHIAIESSLTGHLVFSTLHTNTAPETITRLLDMGIDPFAFADALLGVLAQRLVRTYCQSCKQELPYTDEIRTQLMNEFDNADTYTSICESSPPTLHTANPQGCETCALSGYRGRTAIHELMQVSDRIREHIFHHATAASIRDTAKQEGMFTLKQDGIAKVLAGLTSLENIRAVCAR